MKVLAIAVTVLALGLGGVPLSGGWVSRFECRTCRRVEAGDHLLIFGEVERFETREGDALAFYRGGYGPIARTES